MATSRSTPTIVPDDRLHVVVGVISDRQGRLLLQRRPPGTPCAGQWEFPGGKVETGESAAAALIRELEEELGIAVKQVIPLTQIAHDYSHARVWLEVYRVSEYQHPVSSCEGQEIRWCSLDQSKRLNLLAAAWPILRAVSSSA